MAFWAQGFWKSGFWRDNFWKGMSSGPPPPPPFPPAPTLLAPPPDASGIALQTQIATVQALVNATTTDAAVYPAYGQLLNGLQIEIVDHFMSTGWANAAAILAIWQPPAWDKVGQALASQVAFLQNLYNNTPAMPPGNANGYGGSGWTTIASNYLQQLYTAQTALVDHLMTLPGGTAAATILSGMTGSQTAPAGIPYTYKFASVGFTDADTED